MEVIVGPQISLNGLHANGVGDEGMDEADLDLGHDQRACRGEEGADDLPGHARRGEVGGRLGLVDVDGTAGCAVIEDGVASGPAEARDRPGDGDLVLLAEGQAGEGPRRRVAGGAVALVVAAADTCTRDCRP